MQTSEAEKDWLRRICGGQPVTEQKTAPAKEAELFYGHAGCGKTFFAEKMAEEIGINFMKIVPDDLACTWVHGTQQKIGEVFKDAEKKAPTLLFFDEFDAMVPKRSGDEANQHYDSLFEPRICADFWLRRYEV